MMKATPLGLDLSMGKAHQMVGQAHHGPLSEEEYMQLKAATRTLGI